MALYDPSSLANISEIRTTHIHLNWNISFDERKFSGHVVLDLLAVAKVDKIVLDTSYLDIKSASIDGQDLKVKYRLL